MVVLPISVIPPIAYFKLGLTYDDLCIDGWEHYVKQTIRNRYHILTANGPQALTVHVKGQNGLHVPTQEIEIDYEKPWVKDHLRAIESAYRSAPFFEHYFPFIELLFAAKHDTLRSFFEASMQIWKKQLGTKFEWQFSESYVESETELDLRSKIKKPVDISSEFHSKPYIQVFSDRYSFTSNLSIIDLLFNLGPESISHIRP